MSVAAWIGLGLAYLVVGFVVAVILEYVFAEFSIGFMGATLVAWPAWLVILAFGFAGNGALWCAEKLHARVKRRRDWKDTLRYRALHPNWEADFKAEQAARARP
jgi:hypothetical protein